MERMWVSCTYYANTAHAVTSSSPGGSGHSLAGREGSLIAEPTTRPEEFALKFDVAASGSLEEALTAELSSDYLEQAVAARLLIDAAKLLGVAIA
jgi:hypothetical protein